MTINTEYLERYIETLERSYILIKTVDEGSIDYEMYRNSLVKSFEITLEQSRKLPESFQKEILSNYIII